MSRDILVFDAGDFVGKVEIEDPDSDNSNIMAIVKANLDGKEVDVLYILDMDYGIVIPEHIAKTIYNLV
jgi:hypothetical protein